MSSTRVILIGGPSHSGKSSLAIEMAKKLGWSHVSTDRMARHPGRPWKTDTTAVPGQVADHYLSLSVDELIADVMRHYNRMWPGIEALVRTHASDLSADRLILEGSAVLPERVAALDVDGVAALWLTADSELLEARVHASSGYNRAAPGEKALVQKFVERNHRYNDRMMDAVNRLGLVSFHVGTVSSIDDLTERCIGLVAR